MRTLRSAWRFTLVCACIAGCDRTPPPAPEKASKTAPQTTRFGNLGEPDAGEQDAGPPPQERLRQAVDTAAKTAKEYPRAFREGKNDASQLVLMAAIAAFMETPPPGSNARLEDVHVTKVGSASLTDDGRLRLELEYADDVVRFEPFQPVFDQQCVTVPGDEFDKPGGPGASIEKWKNPSVWMRFEGEETAPLWLRFDKQDATLWKHDDTRDCAFSIVVSDSIVRVKDAGREPGGFPDSYPGGIGEVAMPGAYGLSLEKAVFSATWKPGDDPVDKRADLLPMRGEEKVTLGPDGVAILDASGDELFVHRPEQKWEKGEEWPCGDARISTHKVGKDHYVRLRGTYGEFNCIGDESLSWRFDALAQVEEEEVVTYYSWAAGEGAGSYHGRSAEDVELRLPSGNGYLLYRRTDRSESSDGPAGYAEERTVDSEGRTRWAFELEERTIPLADLRYDIETSTLVPAGGMYE